MTTTITHDPDSPGEVSIRFHAWPTSPHMTQLPAQCQTMLTTGEHTEGPLRIVGVRVNGEAKRFRSISDSIVTVSPPIPYHWDRIELHCKALYEVPSAPRPSPTALAPAPVYGLQPRALTIPARTGP